MGHFDPQFLKKSEALVGYNAVLYLNLCYIKGCYNETVTTITLNFCNQSARPGGGLSLDGIRCRCK